MLSTTEAIHFGVPIIAIPARGDQFLNVNRAVPKGFVIKVDLTYNLAEDLENAIQQMIDDPRSVTCEVNDDKILDLPLKKILILKVKFLV